MTSKQPLQTNSQSVAGVMPASPAIKDSPAVERALNRSKLYLLVSWSQLYPEDDEFLDYVQCGEFVEDGRAALDALDQALDGIGGERAKLKLVLLAGGFAPTASHYHDTSPAAIAASAHRFEHPVLTGQYSRYPFEAVD